MTDKTQADILDQDKIKRETEIRRVVSRRDPVLIAQGVEAYKRDVPKLIAEEKEKYFVAYKGSDQVAIASSRTRLQKILKEGSYTKRGELFITIVNRSDVKTDNIER